MENNIDIWQSVDIKKHKLKNRVIRSATNEHLGTTDGLITEEYIKVYETLSKNDIGLIITSHMTIDKNQRADLTHICLDDERNIKGLMRLTDIVHQNNSKIVAQISYGGHKAIKNFKHKIQTPSSNEEPNYMSLNDINECIEGYVRATKILETIGFDGVQLHLAHGYLLSEFLDPFYNHRTDIFGGNVTNRYRIIHEIMTKIQETINPNFLVMAKIDTTSKDKTLDILNDQIQVCKYLEQDGIDAIELSGNNYHDLKQEEPYFLQNTLAIRKQISVPLILVGGFRNINQINMVLSQGINFVSMSRPFIAEPNFVSKLKESKSSICINCNSCLKRYKTTHKLCIFSESTNIQLEKNFPSQTNQEKTKRILQKVNTGV